MSAGKRGLLGGVALIALVFAAAALSEWAGWLWLTMT